MAALKANISKYWYALTEGGIPVHIRITRTGQMQNHKITAFWSFWWVQKTLQVENLTEQQLILLEGTFSCGNKAIKPGSGGAAVTRTFSLNRLCSQPTLIASPRVRASEFICTSWRVSAGPHLKSCGNPREASEMRLPGSRDQCLRLMKAALPIKCSARFLLMMTHP